MNVLTDIYFHPEYPIGELSEDSVEGIKSLMSTKLSVAQAEQNTGSSSLDILATHPTIALPSLDRRDGYYIDAIGHGMSVLGAISRAVRGIRPVSSQAFLLSKETGEMMVAVRGDGLDDDAARLVSDFRERMPHSTEVIDEASRQYFGKLTEYALYGAALERQIILDSVPRL